MHIGYVLRMVGMLLVFLGATMLMPVGFSLYYRDSGLLPLLQGMAVTIIAGGLLYALFHKKGVSAAIGHREGMAVVTLGWFGAGIAGGLPFILGDVFDTYTDAFFESFSGFTTTGATVLGNIEAVPKSLLMWRSLTHWLGGMGIIVLSLAILPFAGVGGMQMYKAEMTGPVKDKLKPTIRDTATALWKVYLFFSVLLAVLLLFGGMDLFDALCHTFGTIATAGFSPKNTSVMAFDSVYLEVVIIVFMFIGGTNFALLYKLLHGKPMALLRDGEFRFYAIVLVLVMVVMAAYMSGSVYPDFWQSLRYSAFQVTSIGTTTGLVTADYEQWPSLPLILLVFLMFLGGCGGSTAGSMKSMRVILLFKQAYREIFRLIHPRSVKHVKMGGKIVPPEVLQGVWGYFILLLGLFALASFLLALMGVDMGTAFAAALACILNIGPGFAAVGPMDHYGSLPEAGKWVLMFCMLLGRLEIYTVIILFAPEFWRK
jgi:trk system potassium uptake protein